MSSRYSFASIVLYFALTASTSLGLAGQSVTAPAVKPSTVNVPRQASGLPVGAPQLPVHEKFATFRAGEYKSVFLLQNFRSDVSVQVTPALILSSGEISMDPVTLQPHSATTVDISAFLQAHGLPDKAGTAVLRYTFSPYAAVSAVVLSSDNVHRLYVNSYAQSPEEYWQGTSYDATLWAPDEGTKGSISVINTSQEQRTVQVTYLVNGHSEQQPPITIPPRTTHTLNIDDLVNRSRETGAGIHVEYSEYPGTILVEGHLINKDTGFEKYIHFLDKTLRYPNGTVRTQFLLLGQQPVEDGFPSGMSFRSVAVVHNIDSVRVHVTPTLKYDRNGSPKSVSLKPLTLDVGESRIIDLGVEQRAGRVPDDFHQGSLMLDPNTDHASIVAELFNFDDKTGGFTIGPMFFAYPGRATQSVWRTDGTFQTTIMIENTAAQDDSVTLQLFSDSGTYSKTFPIAAGHLLKINLKQLQQENVPDENGRTLADTYGSLSIAGKNGHLSKLSFDKLIHSAIDSDYVGLPGGPGSCVSVQSVFMFLSGSQNPYEVWEESDWTDGTVEDWHTSGSSTSSTNMMQIWGTSSGDMANLFAVDTQTHRIAFFGQQTPVMDCPACSEDDETPEGIVSIPARQACPSTVSVTGITPIPLENGFPTYKTGLGGFATMVVGPGELAGVGINYFNVQITEAVSPVSNGCPANSLPADICAGSTTFTVGGGASDFGVNMPAGVLNTFYDEHAAGEPTDILANTPIVQVSCQVVCSQTYSCDGSPIGNFTITRTFTKDEIQNTPVAREAVTKQ